MPSNSHQLLARVNFPLYSAAFLSTRHLLVSGGGGKAKTGVPNVIEIYELCNNGSTCRAESVKHYETGDEAIMNSAVIPSNKNILLAGMGGFCALFKISHVVADENSVQEKHTDEQENCLRRRTPNSMSVIKETKAKAECSNSHFHIKLLQKFQTDFSEDPFQKFVRYSAAKKLVVTCGADGHIKLWKFPNFNCPIHDIDAHSDEVDNVDFCPLGEKLVSVSKDGKAKIWKTESGTLLGELQYALPSDCVGEKYIYRCVKFGIVEDKNDVALFGALNPAVRKKPPRKCFIVKWDTAKFSLQKIVSTGTDMLSVMAISDDGHFLGFGTFEGCVKIYIAFSLQAVYHLDHAHNIFVTGLEFLPVNEESRRITGGHETSLVSISVDNHVIIHHIPMRTTMGMVSVIILFILTLLTVFVLMDFFNL